MIDKMNSEYFEIPKYEIVCEECSDLFVTSDANAKVCYDCWQKIVDLNSEGRGE